MNADQMNEVTLKLLEFWQSNTFGWFRTVESQFTLHGITAVDTKFHKVVASFGSTASAELEGFLSNPLNADKYQSIKKELLKIYQLSPQAKKRPLTHLCWKFKKCSDFSKTSYKSKGLERNKNEILSLYIV